MLRLWRPLGGAFSPFFQPRDRASVILNTLAACRNYQRRGKSRDLIHELHLDHDGKARGYKFSAAL